MDSDGDEERVGPPVNRPVQDQPERRCIVSGVLKPKSEMLRFVVDPDGRIVPDIDQILPGRGLWLSAGRDMIGAAENANAFAKSARRKVVVPDGLADQIEALLRRRCLNLIGLALRAGQLAAGYEKVRSFIAAGDAEVLLAASDGADGGKRKIQGLAQELPAINLFSGAELAGATGREWLVHAAIAKGKLADRFLGATEKLAAFAN